MQIYVRSSCYWYMIIFFNSKRTKEQIVFCVCVYDYDCFQRRCLPNLAPRLTVDGQPSCLLLYS